MKRLLGLLLVMGMVGCGGGDEAPPAGDEALPATPNKPQAKVDERSVQTVDASPAGEAALPATPNEPQAKVDELPVQTVDDSKLVIRGDGLRYVGDSETPFTGVVVAKNRYGQKTSEGTYKGGKRDGKVTTWYPNGQKMEEFTYKDGRREERTAAWYSDGKKAVETTFKDGKKEKKRTAWGPDGQKSWETTFKDGKLVSVTKWDEEGNEIKE